MAVGNVLGSNIINIMLIVGGAALIRPVTFHSDIVRRELLVLLLLTLLCDILLAAYSLGRLDGILLLSVAGYPLIILSISRPALHEGGCTLTREQMAELPQDNNNPVAVMWLVLSFIIMSISARMVIDNASVLACYFGSSDLILDMMVLAIGSSLPKLAALLAGALKRENNIAFSNVIGSNTFNSVIALGAPALLPPGPFNPDTFPRDYWVMLEASIILAARCLSKRRRINRLSGLYWFAGSSPISRRC